MTEVNKFPGLFSNEPIDYGPRRKNRSRYLALRDKSENILVHGVKYLITVDDNDEVVVSENQSILIESGEIKKVFPMERRGEIDFNTIDLIYDASKRSGIVVTPGFINCHAHPPMYLLRSSTVLNREEGTIEEALVKAIKLERAMNEDDLLISTLASFSEEQKMGTTTTLSHYHTPEATSKAAKILDHRLIDAVSVASRTHPEANLESAVDYIKSYQQGFSNPKEFLYSNPMIRPGLCLHYLPRTSFEELKKIGEVCDQYKVIFTFHCGETDNEIKEIHQKFGMGPIEVLRETGLLKPSTIISHGVHLTDEEIKLIAEGGVGVVHLPTSNKIHKSGEFKMKVFDKYGALNQVALGTDSVISKSRLDLITEALQARIMHQESRAISYDDLFKTFTSDAASVLGIPNIGRVAPGYRADLAFWKLKDRGFIPYDQNDPQTLVGNMITHGGRNIRDLMVNGKFVIINRVHSLIDESQLLAEVQKRHMGLRERVQSKD